MGNDSRLPRRSFVKLCTSVISLICTNPQALAKAPAAVRRYNRVQLVDGSGQAIRCRELEIGKNYLFHYPFISTPCFLINLGEVAIEPTRLEAENGVRYEWEGGVGPRRSVVAFSAICAHRMTHPAHSVSFIRYREGPATFKQSDEKMTRRSQIIYCCSEKSVYDPIRGAQVLGGPAPQPLAAIELEEDDRDNVYAIGTSGGEMFEAFFEKFSDRLMLEYKTDKLTELVHIQSTVVPLAEHSRRLIDC
jgi:arsenite oxidase small subunit